MAGAGVCGSRHFAQARPRWRIAPRDNCIRFAMSSSARGPLIWYSLMPETLLDDSAPAVRKSTQSLADRAPERERP